jgi:hypothetical protein
LKELCWQSYRFVVAANGGRIVERRTMEIRKAIIPILAWNRMIHHSTMSSLWKKGNAPRRSWIRPDVKCNKYNCLGHISKICKFQWEKKQEETQIVDQKDYQHRWKLVNW